MGGEKRVFFPRVFCLQLYLEGRVTESEGMSRMTDIEKDLIEYQELYKLLEPVKERVINHRLNHKLKFIQYSEFLDC